MQELEEALRHWAHGLTELAAMKAELAQYMVAKDGPPLGGAAQDLELQWEELYAKVCFLYLCCVVLPWCC